MSDPFSAAASAVGIISLGIQVTQSLYNYYSAVRDLKSDIVHTTNKLERLLELLESLRRQLDSRKFRPDDSEGLAIIQARIGECKECIEELEAEAAKFKQVKPDSVWAATKATARRLAYPYRQSTLQKLDEDVDEVVSHVSFALQLLQQKDISETRDDLEDTKALLGLIRADQVDSKIRGWLKAPDATVNFNLACSKRHSGTGLWFTEGPAFASWLERPSSFLWLNGFAGCGKSVLCAAAIQSAFRHRKSNSRVGIAFFFFTFNDLGKQDVSAMLRALVLQLSGQLRNDHVRLSELHNSYYNGTPPDEALIDCLREIIQSFGDVYIILDALDESPRDEHREAVFDFLVELGSWAEPGMHLLVTSRDEVDIRLMLDARPDQIIGMKNESVDRDITLYVQQHLRDDRRLRKWAEYHKRIETVLTERANGVFRWIDCQFKELAGCPQSEDLLEQLLDSLPRTLDETYERMLLNIPSACQQYARQMLTLLCCAKRPLTVPELADGIAVVLQPVPRLNVKRRLRGVEAVRQVCPGLIETYSGTQAKTSGAPNDHVYVRLAHFSVQEYLESERAQGHGQKAVSRFCIRKLDAHTEIARVCLTILLDPQLPTSENTDEEFPFARYAAACWPLHFRDGNEDSRAESQALQLLRGSEGAFRKWGVLRGSYSSCPNAIYAVSDMAFSSLLAQLLLSRDADVNAKGGEHGSALQVAARNGHGSIVQQLLGHGADVNIKVEGHKSALHQAVINGRHDVVQILLEQNAEVDSRFGGVSALQEAAWAGHRKVVSLLLDHNAEIENQFWGGSALQEAAWAGHRKVVSLLLEHNAEVNFRGASQLTALERAADHGHANIVELILAYNEGADSPRESREAAFLIAAKKGHKDVVKTLLRHDVDPNAKNNGPFTALQAASAKGHDGVIQLLLQHGVDVDVNEDDFGTALHEAVIERKTETVRLLLSHGANPHTRVFHTRGSKKGLMGESALDMALRLGDQDICNLFRADENKSA